MAQARSYLPCPLFQVIDGFFVKRTMDIKESAGYLALLTKGLERMYQVSGCLYLAVDSCLVFIVQARKGGIPVLQLPLRPGKGLAGG